MTANVRNFLLLGVCLLGQASAVCATPLQSNRPVAAAMIAGRITLSIQGTDGRLYLRDASRDSIWRLFPSSSTEPVRSAPWLQESVGGIHNLYALGADPRIEQWLLTPGGVIPTIGFQDAGAIVSSLASARLGQGEQALFAVNADNMVVMRTWDSLSRSWSEWSSMGIRTGFPPYAVQVTPQDVNLYVTTSDGRVLQNWWSGDHWSGWVVPASEPSAFSAPSSVNFDWGHHVLFAQDIQGFPIERTWLNRSWTGWKRLPFRTASAVSPVLGPNGTIELYALSTDNMVIHARRSAQGVWSQPDTLGPIPPCGTDAQDVVVPPVVLPETVVVVPPVVVPETAVVVPPEVNPDPASSNPPLSLLHGRPLAVAVQGGVHVLAIRGLDGGIWSREWKGRAHDDWSAWSRLPSDAGDDFVSSPWLQAAVGGLHNLYALGSSSDQPRIHQWIKDGKGFHATHGLPEVREIVSSLASGHLQQGIQVLFGIGPDSTLRIRTWDSLANRWNGWQRMTGPKTVHPPYVVQVSPTNINLYVTTLDGQIHQNWFDGSSWSGWVVPAYEPVFSAPSSVNFNWNDHVLFGQGPDRHPRMRLWNGVSWTEWSKVPFTALASTSPVVSGPDRLTLYALALDSMIIRADWSIRSGWSKVDTVGPLPPATGDGRPKTHDRGRQEIVRVRDQHVVLPEEATSEGGVLRIHGPSGQVVLRRTVAPKQTRIPVGRLPQGSHWATLNRNTYRLLETP